MQPAVVMRHKFWRDDHLSEILSVSPSISLSEDSGTSPPRAGCDRGQNRAEATPRGHESGMRNI